MAASRVMVPADEFRRMGSGAAFPILPDQAEADIYRVFRSHPRLDLDTADSWRARPYAEFHATADKPLFTLDVVGEGHWKLYKGESFNLWKPDTGTYYGSVSPSVLATLEDKRLPPLAASTLHLRSFRRQSSTMSNRFPYFIQESRFGSFAEQPTRALSSQR